MERKTALKLLDSFSTEGIEISEFILYILTDEVLQTHLLVRSLITSAGDICCLLQAGRTPCLCSDELPTHRELRLFTRIYQEELETLIETQHSWRFNATHAAMNQLEEFRIEEMATIMENDSPHLWNLIRDLLRLKPIHPSAGQEEPMKMAGHNLDADDVNLHCDFIGDGDVEGLIELVTQSPQAARQLKVKRQSAIIRVKIVVIISILMHSANQKVNALASIIGIFLHASRTPERVIEALAHMGLSISINSIHNAISSLSTQSAEMLRELGKSLLIAYAYDNFDVDLKSAVPTAEHSNVSLKHLTSALVFPLRHGVQRDDLKFSDYLWKHSSLNPKANPTDVPTQKSWKDLLSLHSEKDLPIGELSRSQKFIRWKFLYDLFHHGPAQFAEYRDKLPLPAYVDRIPLTKTPTYPTRAMEYSNSTIPGNISTIQNLAFQGGIGDPNDSEQMEDVEDISDYVVMFHGDLGTGERIIAIRLQRRIEETPFTRFQWVIFVPGFFHVKMACIDALWKILIQPQDGRRDPAGLMQDVARLRPKETGIIGSGPRYRQMYQVITHAGICRRLDCWLTEVKIRYSDASINQLTDFALLKPTFSQLEDIAQHLALTYVASGRRLGQLRKQPVERRDKVFENAQLFHKYSLLFEELSYAMNYGDIGRLEACLIPWIFIFRATGKHKYASHMTSFLTEVHFVYPERLRRAVRYHTLINPTGKEGQWRGVDWCVELNNYGTKVEHGGSSSNRTVQHIIKDSPLIQAYRNIKTTIEKNFVLTHLTSRYGDPDMRKTFDDLQKHLQEVKLHKIHPKRGCNYEIPDMMEKGRTMLQVVSDGGVESEDENSTRSDMDDILVELL